MAGRAVDKLEKKNRILDAAISVFAKKGFEQTTINEIATAAGIGKSTIYEYFSNKEEIINYSFNHFMELLALDFSAIPNLKISPIEKLTTILMGFSQFLENHSIEIIELMFDFWSKAIRHKESKGIVFQQMNSFYQSYRDMFTDIIIEGMGDGSLKKNINPRSVASMIIGALDGVMVQWIIDKEAVDYADVSKTIANTILNGIALQPEK
ncbi:MAG: TetR/AcrR family transcriptional regulator [bacterium]|nr:TetR/AcrR family transcriptional regulator [bacterium]